MVRFNLILVAALAVGAIARRKDHCRPGKPSTSPVPTSSESVDTRCPTVTETATLCGKCPVKECFAVSSITNKCGCSTPIPTFTTSYPCGPDGEYDQCPEGCATTSYVYGSSSTCPPSSDSTPTTPPTITSTIKQCPTVTSTLGVCSTCIQPACLEVSTISLDCDCETSIPTVYASYPCDGSCPGGCQGTSYVYATETPICGSQPPGSCVPTVTVTACPSDNPAPNLCIADAILTLPCGCATATSIYSEVVYDTRTPCMACSTGWMYTTTEACPTPTPTLY